MAGWTDAGNFGELAGAMPAGGEPGQVLVKTATDNYAVEWTDWCNELNLTPNMFLLENRLVDAIPYLTEQSPPNDPPLWMSDYGMNATQGSIATLPAEGSRTSDYFAQAFQINWPADSQAQGTYASVEQDPHYLQYFFTFTADAPGSLEILLAGVDGEELTGSVEAVVTPTDTSDVSWDPDPYHQYIIGYGSTGSLGEGGGVPITEPTEYSVRIRYSPGANIRQHLPYDDPSLELLFQQPTGELSVTYESFDALGKTGEVYDQGLSDIDACYGTDLHRIITETIQRVPTKPLVYGAALFGDESPIDQIIATRSKLLYFGTPFGIRHDESTGGLRINGQYTYYNTTSELLVVTQGLVRDLPGFSSRAATHPIWAGVWVTLRLEDAEFNQDLALSAKLELFLMKNALDPPEPVAERTVMVPAAGAWQLPTTAFLVGEVYGDSESLTKLALGWHVRVTLTDPTLDPTLQDKRLIVDWMTASPQMDGL
jgi:hypothetical protein